MRTKRKARPKRKQGRLFRTMATLIVLAGTALLGEAGLLYKHVSLPWQVEQVKAEMAVIKATVAPEVEVVTHHAFHPVAEPTPAPESKKGGKAVTAQKPGVTPTPQKQVVKPITQTAPKPIAKPAPVTPQTKPVQKQATRPDSAKVVVATQSQEPELYNGCEVTSLSMLLTSAGHPVDKMTLANNVPKDPTPEQQDSNGNTVYWGNPNTGFVGDVTGANRGYGVYHGPLTQLLKQYLPGRAVDLTGSSFDKLLDTLASGRPVVVWTTVNFTPPTSWVTWNSPTGKVKASFNEHCVLLVGYDPNTVTINDPLDGTTKSVDRQNFEQSWMQMGQQAVTYQAQS